MQTGNNAQRRGASASKKKTIVSALVSRNSELDELCGRNHGLEVHASLNREIQASSNRTRLPDDVRMARVARALPRWTYRASPYFPPTPIQGYRHHPSSMRRYGAVSMKFGMPEMEYYYPETLYRCPPEPDEMDYGFGDELTAYARNEDNSANLFDPVEMGKELVAKESQEEMMNEFDDSTGAVDLMALAECIRVLQENGRNDLGLAVLGIAAKVNANTLELASIRDELQYLRFRPYYPCHPYDMNGYQNRPSNQNGQKVSQTTGSSSRSSERTLTTEELTYDPSRIKTCKIPIPSVSGIPARENLGVYVEELIMDGEFSRNRSLIERVQKVSRYIIERIIPPHMYAIFTVRQKPGSQNNEDLPVVILRAIQDLHFACCGLPKHCVLEPAVMAISAATERSIKNALTDLRRSNLPKMSSRARMRNVAEYGPECSIESLKKTWNTSLFADTGKSPDSLKGSNDNESFDKLRVKAL